MIACSRFPTAKTMGVEGKITRMAPAMAPGTLAVLVPSAGATRNAPRRKAAASLRLRVLHRSDRGA